MEKSLTVLCNGFTVEIAEEIPKTYCNRCHNAVYKSDNPEYTYQCFECDEDLYEFETYTTD